MYKAALNNMDHISYIIKYIYIFFTGKRTLHNPFMGRDQTWDPYGIAKFNMGSLLEGQKMTYMSAPIHMCPTPDPLGGREGKMDGKLVGVAGSVDGPSKYSALIGGNVRQLIGANCDGLLKLLHLSGLLVTN